jgi:serine/threonine protein kinase
MAEVHLARSHVPGEEGYVVIKRLHPHLVGDDEWVSMLIDEANVGARLDHEDIARVHRVVDHDGVMFLVMEYVDGVDLLRLFKLARHQRSLVPLHHSLRVMASAARALDYVHNLRDHRGEPLGIVHRDISMSNIMVTYDGHAKLIDFGVATGHERLTHTQAGILKGKSRYMSPEQVRGRPVDRRSDVFSLGIVLWELTTGKPLFRGRDELDCMRRVVKQTIPLPSERALNYPRELERIVMRALARNPKHRYQSAGELAADLEAFARGRSRQSSATKLSEFIGDLFPDGRRVAHEEPSDRYEFGQLLRMNAPQQLDWCPDTAEVSAFLDSALGFMQMSA